MNTKTCCGCKLDLGLERFNRNKAKKDGHSAYCKTCQGIKQKAYYNGPAKDTYRARIEVTAKIRQDRVASFVNQLKSEPCTDCLKRFHPICMDFDHLPQFVKSRDITDMVAYGLSLEAVQKEIAKCELVCSNCHRLRTYLRRVRLQVRSPSSQDGQAGSIPVRDTEALIV